MQKRIQNLVKHLRWSILQKIGNSLKPLIIFAKHSFLELWLVCKKDCVMVHSIG